MWLRFPGGAVERDFVLTLLHGASSKMLKNTEKACKLLKKGKFILKSKRTAWRHCCLPFSASSMFMQWCTRFSDAPCLLSFMAPDSMISSSFSELTFVIHVLCSWLEMDKLGHKSAMRFLYLDTCHLMHTYITTVVPGLECWVIILLFGQIWCVFMHFLNLRACSGWVQ